MTKEMSGEQMLVQELKRQVAAQARLLARIAQAIGRDTWQGDLADAVAAQSAAPVGEPCVVHSIDTATERCTVCGHDVIHFDRILAAPPPSTPQVMEMEAVRRKAQDFADFWYEQAGKNESKRGHYEVIVSQFQRLAALAKPGDS